MAGHREWGLLCPEGHGLLVQRDEWDRQGVAWCPHAGHKSNNGRFYRTAEVKEGWWDTSRITTTFDDSTAQEMRERAEARTAAWEENRRRHMPEKKEKVARAAKVKEPQACLCGCGGSTKGGRFLPGHDARYHARIKAAMAAGKTHEEAERLAAKGPLPASLLPKPEPKAPKAEAVKAAPKPRAAKPKPVDLTSRATDEVVPDQTVTEPAAEAAIEI